MLCLNRKINESIIIGDHEIKITVDQINGKEVSLAIDCDDHTVVKLVEKINQEDTS